MDFKPGTLWNAIVERSASARRAGALQPIGTNLERIEEGGIRFVVAVRAALHRKKLALDERKKAAGSAGGRFNPFLPPEPDLLVADLSDTHRAVLNKYNVIDHHLLIVTRQFEDQEMLLTRSDFEALWTGLSEINGLGFYNGGPAAGASQPHKHLQIVPLPLAAGEPAVPIGPVLPAENSGERFSRISVYPFLHVFARLGKNAPPSAEAAYETYYGMLKRAGMGTPGGNRPVRQSGPYCLLATRKWMLLVPRVREHFDSISINALGYAGAFYVGDRPALDRLRRAGPLRALTEVARPAPSGG
jgi:ATP adenylyltransferase